MRNLSTTLCTMALTACAGLQPTPVAWTPQLVEVTQQSFSLHGEWSFTSRSGSNFGARCDILFSPDNTYRKSCRPPVEESGEWRRSEIWDGHTTRVQLRKRVDLINRRDLGDLELPIVVQSPQHDVIHLGDDLYERQ